MQGPSLVGPFSHTFFNFRQFAPENGRLSYVHASADLQRSEREVGPTHKLELPASLSLVSALSHPAEHQVMHCRPLLLLLRHAAGEGR